MHEKLEDWQGMPPHDLKCCYNCQKWHRSDYIHCRCSGPWGGNILGDINCNFIGIEDEESNQDQ
jgi:hypothetical protein